MKILFLQDQEFMFFGVLSLYGYLKQYSNHKCDVLMDSLEKDLTGEIKKIKPDIIGFSILSNDYQWFKSKVKIVKSNFPDIPVIAGGVHTLLHNNLIENPYIDLTCNGEGEKVLKELLDRMEEGREYNDIEGLNVKIDGKIFFNGVAPPIQDLDSFMDDREVYMNRYPQFRDDRALQMISSRGCPLKCTFCMNEIYHKLYNGKGKIYRWKSIEHIIKEIRKTMEFQQNASRIYFVDDLFMSNKKRFIELARQIKKELNLKFWGGGLPNCIDEEVVSVMKETNFVTFNTAPETANDEHRRRIFKKNTTNEDYYRAAEILHRFGIKFYTANIFAYPEQTFKDALDMAELNIKLKTDYPCSSLLLPYPGTAIEKMAKEKGHLPPEWGFDDIPKSYFETSVLNIPDKKRIVKAYKLFYFLVRYPFLFKILKRYDSLINYIPFTRYIYYLGLFLFFKRSRDFGFFECLMYFWRFRKNH